MVLGGINMDVVATVERMPEPGETVHGDGFFMAGGGKHRCAITAPVAS